MTPYSSYRTLYPVDQTNIPLAAPMGEEVAQKDEEEYEDIQVKALDDNEGQEDYETIPGTRVSANTSQISINEEQYTYMEGLGNITETSLPEHMKAHSEEELYESITENN